ncbi:hypothetical protein BH11ARM2_BH11ARM2_03310 [soil metagenome]
MLALLATMALTAAPDWKLVWSDEFNGSGLPDPKKWGYEKGFIRNHEAQFYTERRTENVRQEGGKLVIEARKDDFEGHPISSGSINTRGKGDWTYGRIEVRAKIPTGKGTWPAVWMLGSNIDTIGWPRCGEIDMMENVGFDPARMHFNIHNPKMSGAKGSVSSFNTVMEKPWEAFHTYAMEWFPDRLDLFMDGKKMLSYLNDGRGDEETWPYHRPQYLLLNVAIGGDWGGQQGIDDTIFPCRMEVDYVRVYRDKNLKWPTDI